MTISQRSNTYIQSYYKFAEKLENFLMFFVALSMKEYTLGCYLMDSLKLEKNGIVYGGK
jgi:hypothetical protein